MLKVFVISPSKIVAGAVKVAAERRHPHLAGYVRQVLIDSKAGAIDAFRACAEMIEGEMTSGDLVHDRFVGVLDLPRVSSATEIPSLSSVQGMLVLAFPEIQWVPLFKDARLFDEGEIFKKSDKKESKAGGKTAEKDRGAEPCVMTFDLAVELCKGNYTPLFDGDGLRGQLLKRVHGGRDESSDKGEIFTRHDIALVVDEEPHFAYVNSYTAYRFGYRVYPITSGACADRLLRKKGCLPSVRGLTRKKGAGESAREPTIVALEDVYLQFPDRTATYGKETAFGHWRDQAFPVLRDCHMRVISTAAQEGEKYAEDKECRKTTPEEYFAGETSSDGRPYRALSKRSGAGAPLRLRLLSWWRRQRRLIFNVCRAWPGYWLLALASFSVALSVLVGTFFWRPAWTLPVCVALFLLRGIWSEDFFRRIRQTIGTVPALERFRKRRRQWQFLPMLFAGHAPQNDVHRHGIVLWCVARKPLAGMFGLRNSCGLPDGRGFRGVDSSSEIEKLYRKARSKGQFCYDEESDDSGHAAPGAAQEVSAFILRRCEKLKDSIVDAEGAVHAAVLATVAGELLNFKTPAMSIEALTWKQYFEICAECEFVGVQAHPDMTDRYIDIHNTMRRLCRAADGTIREDVYDSGMAELMDKLSLLLSEKGKREEELFFLRKARYFHRRLMIPVMRSLLAYPEWVMRSSVNFAISFVLVSAVFCAYWMLRVDPQSGVLHALSKTYEVLLCDQPDISYPKIGMLVDKDTFIVLVHTMRQITLLHLAFLGFCFWDTMRQK